LVIISAGARPITPVSGRLPLAPGISNISNVLPRLRNIRSGKPHWWEPKWGRATDCIDAARDLRIQNLLTVSAAIGATPSPADDLRIIRNFYAHRSKASFAEVQRVAMSIGVTGRAHPDDVIVYTTSGGMPLYRSWINEFLDIAEAAIQ
jgi:hypothetical protein